MKKAIAISMFALILSSANATANEILGTRVLGQGAICAEGEGKAIEINATTKQEWSYCLKREVITAPTPTPLSTQISSPTPTPSPTATATTNATIRVNEPAPTQTTETAAPSTTQTPTTESATVTALPTPTPTATPTPTPTIPSAPANVEKSNRIEVNASTNTVVVREETDEEWLERWLRAWDHWYLELAKWLNNLWNWSSL